jgi:uncharacterized protein YjiS (DUF1127 family)
MHPSWTTRVPVAPIESLATLLSGGVEGCSQTLRTWREAEREHHALHLLADELAHEIGRSQAEIEQEAGRWFWDLPRRLR